jgi:hypothetical protein
MNVTPINLMVDGVNLALAHAVECCDVPLKHSIGSEFVDLHCGLVRKLGFPMRLAVREHSLPGSVLAVFRGTAKEEVRRVAAQLIVATWTVVVHAHSFWNVTIGKFPRKLACCLWACSIITPTLSTRATEIIWTNSGSYIAPTGMSNIVAGNVAGTGTIDFISRSLVNLGYLSGTSTTNLYGAPAFSLFNIGNQAGAFATFESSAVEIHNWGFRAGHAAKYIDIDDVYNYGYNAGGSAVHQQGDHIYNYGDWAGYQAKITNSYYLFNFGYQSGKGTAYTDSGDIYNLGHNANSLRSFVGKFHMVALGSGAKTTNSGDFVFGDSQYNYKFPGASFTTASGITTPNPSGGTGTPWKFGAFKSSPPVSLVSTGYIEVEIGGVIRKLAIIQ